MTRPTLMLLRRATLSILAAASLGGCAAMMVGGAIGTGMMVADRRTAGAQVEDQSIELKAATRIQDTVGDRGHINATSYNGTVLLTGEVPTEADRGAIEQAISRVESVRWVVNELAVMPPTSLTDRSNDSFLTSKVKATFFDAKELQANTLKVVTERSTVFLMGRVTEREASRAAQLARGVSGVKKVVRVFEILTEAELADLGSKKT